MSSADPLAWLAAADALEERGDSAAARVWRLRGEAYPVIVGLYARMQELRAEYEAQRQAPAPPLTARAINDAMTYLSPQALAAPARPVRVTQELLDDAAFEMPLLLSTPAFGVPVRVEVEPRPGWQVSAMHNASGSSFAYTARVNGKPVDSGWWGLGHAPDVRPTTQRVVKLIDAMRAAEDAGVEPKGDESDEENV